MARHRVAPTVARSRQTVAPLLTVNESAITPSTGSALIITCHNYGQYLNECLDSALAQTLAFDAIIVVDDAGSDNCAEVVAAFVDRGVRYLRTDFGHPSPARNAGARLAPDVEFYLFLDADDYIARDYHELLRQLFESSDPRLAVAYSSMRLFRDEADGRLDLGMASQPRPFDHAALRSSNFINCAALIRRQVFEQVGGWPITDSTFEDWMLWLKMARHGWSMQFVPTAILHYRRHTDSRMQAYSASKNVDILPFREAAQTTIVTLFSGRGWMLERWFNWLKQLEWMHMNLHLVAIDNSDDYWFSERLKKQLIDCGVGFTYVRDTSHVASGISAEHMGESRANRNQYGFAISRHLAHLYSVARAHLPHGTDFVWCIEDDVEPDRDALLQLFKGLRDDPKTGVVCGLLPSRFLKNHEIMAFCNGKPISPPASGTFETVNASGFYCTLFRRSTFDAIAFRPTTNWSDTGPPAYDIAAAADVEARGELWKAAGSVPCKHWQSDGTALRCKPPGEDLLVRSLAQPRIVCGFITPQLTMGGAERWLSSLIHATDRTKLEWRAVVSLSPGGHPDIVQDIQKICQVRYGEVEIQSLQDECDLILLWGIANSSRFFTRSNACSKNVYVSQGPGEWSLGIMSDTHYADARVACSRIATMGFPPELRDNVTIIYNAVDERRLVPNCTRAEMRHAWGIPDDVHLVGYTGRLAWEKYPRALVDGIAELDERWWGIFIGDGPKRSELERLVRDRGAGRIVFAGQCDNIADALCALDWGFLASDSEGCSLSLLEFWYMGIPVVATSVGQLTEQPDYARILPHRPSGQEVAAALLEDLEHEELRSQRCRDAQWFVRENLTMAHFGRRWTDYIQSVVHN